MCPSTGVALVTTELANELTKNSYNFANVHENKKFLGFIV